MDEIFGKWTEFIGKLLATRWLRDQQESMQTAMNQDTPNSEAHDAAAVTDKPEKNGLFDDSPK